MLNLELVVLLDAVHRRGSYAGAAEELGRVPSAVSYTIQKYEAELGVSLFARAGRGVRFTEAGEYVHREGLALLNSARTLTETAQAIARGSEPRLRIAIEAWLTLDAVLPPLTHFLAAHPEVELQISEEALSGTWEALIERRVDVAVGAPTPKPVGQRIQSEPLCRIDRVLAVAPGHPLAKRRKPIAVEELQSQRWVMLRDTARQWVPRNILAFTPRQRFVVGSMRDKIAAQSAGVGIGFLPRERIRDDIAAGRLVVVPTLEAPAGETLLLAWRSDSRGAGLQELLHLLKAHLRSAAEPLEHN